MQQMLSGTPGVAAVSAPSVNPAGTTAALNVVPTTAPVTPPRPALVEHVRVDVLRETTNRPLTGTTAAYVDFTNKVADRMP